MSPLLFAIPVHDFDLELLPPNARALNTLEFRQAVKDRITSEYEQFTDRVVVDVDDKIITVTIWPKLDGIDPVDMAIDLLQSGDLIRGSDMLEAIVSAKPKDRAVLFNLGMAKSDLGETSDAIKYLARFLMLEPGHAGALTALGLAYYRSGDTFSAIEIMRKGVEAEPDNGYAQRNLGGVLAAQGRKEEAAHHLLEAARILPNDVRALF